MSDTSNTIPMRDDLDEYLASLSDEERKRITDADAALDLAMMLYEARLARGLTQTEAASLSGLRQQVISRWERSHPNIQLASLHRYLAALGYTLGIVVSDAETGEVVASAGIPTSAP